MSTNPKPVQGCPQCGGINGYSGTMTETHQMGGAWGYQPEAGESGINVSYSLMSCNECGFKFRLGSARTKDWKNY